MSKFVKIKVYNPELTNVVLRDDCNKDYSTCELGISGYPSIYSTHEITDDEDYSRCNLESYEYPSIYLNHEITDDELNNAYNVLITAFMQRGYYDVTIDLDERERSLFAKEMTLEEIEKTLGHKVKIVNKKKEEK